MTTFNTFKAASIDDASPVPEGFQRVENGVIEDIFGSLMELATRRLEEQDNAKRVVTLLRRFFDKPRKIYQQLRDQVILDIPVPEDWESTETLPVMINERRQRALNALRDATQDIPVIPKNLLITDKDLPRRIKGELGDRNQYSLASIIHGLHFVYAGFDAEELGPGEDGTKEE